MKLIHYGADKYNPNLFTPVKNSRSWHKPASGGLWTSPINSEYGWKEWNDQNEYSDCNQSFIITIKTDTLLVIDSYTDLMNILKDYHYSRDLNPFNQCLDYEKISEDYDAIHLTSKGEQETRFTNPNLYGYDCETVLILNKQCIIN